MTVSKYGLPDGKDRVVASFRSLSLADIKGMIVRAAEQGIVKAANAKFHVKHFRKELVSDFLQPTKAQAAPAPTFDKYKSQQRPAGLSWLEVEYKNSNNI